MVELTAYGDSRGDVVVFASGVKIREDHDLLKVLPDEFVQWGEAYEIVYLGASA
ncbi:hypothetical protein [Burkholderia sp. F1]|uniref:hypothetical protein n=1 Tax=Burkholderia sp. F1 TaxID=3366817 RepID=UPI003D740CAA